MKDSFIFYKSFMDAIDTIPQIKYKYLLLESIIKLGLFSDKSYEKLISFCEETEQKLSKNSQVLGLFFAIKPQLIANYRKYVNGCKGAEHGALGGAPKGNKNAQKTTPKQPPMYNVLNEECIMNNVLNGVGVAEKKINEEKKSDPLISQTRKIFDEEYEKIFNVKPFLSFQDGMKLSELSAQYDDFKRLIPIALSHLKNIDFKDIDFKPSATWLLKGNNFERVMNGEFEKNKSDVSNVIDAWVKGTQ